MSEHLPSDNGPQDVNPSRRVARFFISAAGTGVGSLGLGASISYFEAGRPISDAVLAYFGGGGTLIAATNWESMFATNEVAQN